MNTKTKQVKVYVQDVVDGLVKGRPRVSAECASKEEADKYIQERYFLKHVYFYFTR